LEFGVWGLEFSQRTTVATIQRFEDLECWKVGRQLRQTVYRFTRLKAFASDYALVGQIRRAAQSVTANIAEGFEREGNREFIQFLSQAKGSVGEVKDQLYTALDECYITQTDFDGAYALAEDTTRLIGGLMSYLRQAETTGSKFKRRPA
jgi:four helix bundle protein